MKKFINKTMDVQDLYRDDAKDIIVGLNDVITQLRANKLKISSWYGTFNLCGDRLSLEWVNRGTHYQDLIGSVDDNNFPWFLYWEICWIIMNNDFRPGDRLLDLGGSSSLFSYYMASKGLEVTTVDLQSNLVENAEHVASQMGWKLKNVVTDMRYMTFTEEFDHITSICVYEHIPMYDRVEINTRIKKLLAPGGTFSITFDYRNPSKVARISTPADVREQFVDPSGLAIRGNPEFFDNGKNYLLHPFYAKQSTMSYKRYCIQQGYFDPGELDKVKDKNDYTFGALFQKKYK